MSQLFLQLLKTLSGIQVFSENEMSKLKEKDPELYNKSIAQIRERGLILPYSHVWLIEMHTQELRDIAAKTIITTDIPPHIEELLKLETDNTHKILVDSQYLRDISNFIYLVSEGAPVRLEIISHKHGKLLKFVNKDVNFLLASLAEEADAQ